MFSRLFLQVFIVFFFENWWKLKNGTFWVGNYYFFLCRKVHRVGEGMNNWKLMAAFTSWFLFNGSCRTEPILFFPISSSCHFFFHFFFLVSASYSSFNSLLIHFFASLFFFGWNWFNKFPPNRSSLARLWYAHNSKKNLKNVKSKRSGQNFFFLKSTQFFDTEVLTHTHTHNGNVCHLLCWFSPHFDWLVCVCVVCLCLVQAKIRKKKLLLV